MFEIPCRRTDTNHTHTTPFNIKLSLLLYSILDKLWVNLLYSNLFSGVLSLVLLLILGVTSFKVSSSMLSFHVISFKVPTFKTSSIAPSSTKDKSELVLLSSLRSSTSGLSLSFLLSVSGLSLSLLSLNWSLTFFSFWANHLLFLSVYLATISLHDNHSSCNCGRVSLLSISR